MTKECQELLEYLNYQFPATVGHIPLREKLELISNDLELMRKQLTVARRVVIHQHTRSPDGFLQA